MSIDEKTLKELLKDAPDHYRYINLSIDHAICILGECRLCIDKCPTNAFYQKERVELIPELCVGCGACVLVCMVPGCIILTRERKDTGRKETLTTPKDVEKSLSALNKRKKLDVGRKVFAHIIEEI